MSSSPNPDVVGRLDAFIEAKLAVGGAQSMRNTCQFLVSMFGTIIKADTGETVWPEGSEFSRRVIVREEGLTVANFLSEVLSSYGEHAYELVVAVINSPKITQWLDRQPAGQR